MRPLLADLGQDSRTTSMLHPPSSSADSPSVCVCVFEFSDLVIQRIRCNFEPEAMEEPGGSVTGFLLLLAPGAPGPGSVWRPLFLKECKRTLTDQAARKHHSSNDPVSAWLHGNQP